MTLNNYLIDEEPRVATAPNRALERGSFAARKVVETATRWFS